MVKKKIRLTMYEARFGTNEVIGKLGIFYSHKAAEQFRFENRDYFEGNKYTYMLLVED